jgi:hypothetical protein
VKSHIPPEGPGLLPGGDQLPDDKLFESPGGLRFAPGALDGIPMHHGPERETSGEEAAVEIYRSCFALAKRPSLEARSRLLPLLIRAQVRPIVDRVLDMIREMPPRHRDALYTEMRRLFAESGHREVVKFAMAVLGLFRRMEDLSLLRTIARHEEFTSFAIVEIAQILEDPTQEWMAMARQVTGWGKIELVEQLLKNPGPEVCAFLLREGCVNDVHWGYTALPIAVGCRLHEALAVEDLDLPLLQGAGAILETLAEDSVGGGPDGDMLDYPQAGDATEVFLPRFERVAQTLRDFMVVAAIQDFVTSDIEPDKLRAAGWSEARRDTARKICKRILTMPEWRKRAEAGLDSSDERERWVAPEVARRIGLPMEEWLVPRIRRNPLDSHLWWYMVWGADEARMDEAINLTKELLDPESIATGPAANVRGHGPGYEIHDCMDMIVQELRRFPGKGWELIRPSLLSPVVRNRSMAIQALKAWGVGHLTPEMVDAVHASLEDPSKHVRRDAREILGLPDTERFAHP